MILPLGFSPDTRLPVARASPVLPSPVVELCDSYIPRLEISQEARFCRPSVEPVARLARICIDSHFYAFRWRSIQHEGRLGSSSTMGEQHFYTGLIDWDSPVVKKTSRRRSAMPLERESTDSPPSTTRGTKTEIGDVQGVDRHFISLV
ncbi:hypothetical protein JCGZ_20258 [Jatropha curcas]|uniref:Uncharacterized protein n=1 Tax=Jatropha curcas TaxID=180498 RepID=A0A067JX99_JATCU|nr:hypothetical protein JCGZ_20258 [Jatropha curcas]